MIVYMLVYIKMLEQENYITIVLQNLNMIIQNQHTMQKLVHGTQNKENTMDWRERLKPKKMKEQAKPCELCKANHWKTEIKGHSWKCKKCGNIRILVPFISNEPECLIETRLIK